MTDNVVKLSLVTTNEIDPDEVLEGAKGQLSEIFIIGWTPEGDMYMASSGGDLSDLNLMLDIAKQSILNEFFE